MILSIYTILTLTLLVLSILCPSYTIIQSHVYRQDQNCNIHYVIIRLNCFYFHNLFVRLVYYVSDNSRTSLYNNIVNNV